MLKTGFLAEGLKAFVNLLDSFSSGISSHDFASSGAILILIGEHLMQLLKSFENFLSEILRLNFIKFLFIEFTNMLSDFLLSSEEVNSKFIERAESCHTSDRADYETKVTTMPITLEHLSSGVFSRSKATHSVLKLFIIIKWKRILIYRIR